MQSGLKKRSPQRRRSAQPGENIFLERLSLAETGFAAGSEPRVCDGQLATVRSARKCCQVVRAQSWAREPPAQLSKCCMLDSKAACLMLLEQGCGWTPGLCAVTSLFAMASAGIASFSWSRWLSVALCNWC